MSGSLALAIVVLLVASCASAGKSLDEPALVTPPIAVRESPLSLDERQRQEFEARRAAWRGIFITEEEIENARASTLVALFRHVPAVHVACEGSSCGVRLRQLQCSAAFVIDGAPARLSTDLDMPTVGLVGIEIYRAASETPLEFLGGESTCGTIVIWTRSGL